MQGGNILFQSNIWNNTHNIKIFDNQYVYENIYSDEVIDSSKQERIASIILGSDGNRLDQEYQSARSLIEENTQAKSTLTREYGKILGNQLFNFEEFRRLEVDITLDDKIKQTQDQLDSYKNQVSIKHIIDRFLPNLSINLDKAILEHTLEVSSEIVQSHIKRNVSGKKGDEFLKFLEIGTASLIIGQDTNCTYCGQSIHTKDVCELIEAYKTMFSDQYQSLNNEIKNTLKNFKGLELGFLLSKIEKDLSNLGVKIEISKKEEINQYIKDLIGELESKKDNLNYQINFDSLDKLLLLLDEIVIQINPVIIQYSNPIDPNIIKSKESELKCLLLIKERFSPTWLSKCDEYNQLQNTFDTILKPAEEIKFNSKIEYANRILNGYENSINIILRKLRADFELCEFQVPENRKEELKLFGIKFGDHRVELSGEENNCHFKNSLSESDKRLLSFAFFIVDIQNTENLDNFIVIFDDPMSSLDIDRKKMTIETIRDLLVNSDGKTPAQVIILTHEDIFFQMIYNTYKSSTESVFLQVDYNIGTHSSELQVCDVEENFIKTKHFKDLEIFEKFLKGEIVGCPLTDVRKGLEYVIKSKYYLEIPKPVIQSGGVITWYKENKCTGNSLKIQKINDIYPHIAHHDQTGQGLSEDDLQDSERKDIVSKYFEIISEI